MSAASSAGPTLLVIADSLAFHGPGHPMPADEPKLWPNVAAAQLGGRARVFAGAGWTARDAWWALTGDPNLWTVLPEADVLVLAVGSMDTLPSPLPSYLRGGLRYLRPDRLRRWARARYRAAQPALARALRGWPTALPARLTARYLDDCLAAVHALRPDLPVVGILPAVHHSELYGYVQSGYRPGVAAIRAWGARRGVPLVDLAALTADHVRAGLGNPDGMHWGWDAHKAVGSAMAVTIGQAVRQSTEIPGSRRCPGDLVDRET